MSGTAATDSSGANDVRDDVRDGVTDKAADDQVSVADWTAGYEAGYTAGYWAARTALDDAARELADTLRPSAAFDVTQARRRAAERSTTGWATPAERDAYRARVYASWGLTPPTNHPDQTTGRETQAAASGDNQPARHPGAQPDRQPGPHPGRQPSRQSGRQSSRQSGRQSSRQSGRQSSRQSGWQSSLQSGRRSGGSRAADLDRTWWTERTGSPPNTTGSSAGTGRADAAGW